MSQIINEAETCANGFGGWGGVDVGAYSWNLLASDWIRLQEPLQYATKRQHFIGKDASLRMHCDGIAELPSHTRVC